MSNKEGLALTYNYIAANSYNYGKKRSTGGIKYIVIHYTANNGDTSAGNGKYFANNKVGASAHYFVDENGCTQSVDDSLIAYHCETRGMQFKCSCRNANSIGVEMCSDKVNGQYVITEKTAENAAVLTKWLMQKYNISSDNVIRHYDVCGKNCPEPWVRVPSKWNEFKAMLNDTINESEVDDEMVSETYISVNEKDIKINRILKDGKNYIDLRGLENAGFEISFNADTKLPVLNNKITGITVNDKEVEAVNIKDYNYAKIRDLADAVGMEVDYSDGKITVK